jgi:protein-disulfide isomerase
MNDKKFITDSPKTNFFLGILVGVAIISVAGFGFLALSNGDKDTKQVAGEQDNLNGEAKVVEMEITKNDHVLGNPNAPIKIFEFSDFQCPYCQKFHEVMHKVIEERGDEVAWVFKQFPIASHPLGMPGAMATECAGEQGKFWEMSDKIFDNFDTNTADSFAVYAEELGLNVDQYNSCVENEKYKEKIVNDYNLGAESGVRGTPSSFVNGQLLPGAVPFENMQEIIDSLK